MKIQKFSSVSELSRGILRRFLTNLPKVSVPAESEIMSVSCS